MPTLITVLIIIAALIIGGIVAAILTVRISRLINEKLTTETAIKQLKSRKDELQTIIDNLKEQQEYLKSEIEKMRDLETRKLILEKEIAETEQRYQQEVKYQTENIADKVKAEYAKQKLALQQQHEKELNLLSAQHQLQKAKLTEEHGQLTTQINKMKLEIQIAEQQKKDKADQENFIETHSLDISEYDYEDIATLHDIRLKLNKKDVVNDLIWEHFLQKPLQELRKNLLSPKLTDKIQGIYKITHVPSDKSYIGQSTNIGNRWTEHIKTALDNPTDKFHKALRDNKFGDWTWQVLEECQSKEELNKQEKHWIDFYHTMEFGFNTTKGG